MWSSALKPGAVEAFEIAIPAATLTSPRDGLDKNMHEALKVKDHPDIVFRLLRLEPGSGARARCAASVFFKSQVSTGRLPSTSRHSARARP